MNEYEWKKARDPEAMLAAVQDRLSQRKWVLLNCAVARRIAEEWPHEVELKLIGEYELEPTIPSRNVMKLDGFEPMGHPKWGGDYQAEDPRGYAATYFRREARRFETRGERILEELDDMRTEFLSHFPMYASPEAWGHCRSNLSALLYSSAQAKLYFIAEKSVLGQIRKKARTQDSPTVHDEAESKVRTVQKQLVLDMNKAMRNYAKPANELLAHFLHEQLGNPFQPYEFDPVWRTADVMGLAKSIEADRGFDRMNMLADALMEAGCEHETILLHLQEEREHQRGCWVLDLILGHDTEVFARPPLEDVSGTGGRHQPLGLALPRNWDV